MRGKKLKTTIENIPYGIIYQYKLTYWEISNYICLGCSKLFKTITSVERHKEVCSRINTISQFEDYELIKVDYTMPIQMLTIKGEKFYRWGDSGKLYRTREQAEQQAKAIYASGYKEKKDTNKK